MAHTTGLGIKYISYHIPDAVLPNSVVQERFGFEDNFLANKLGIDERPVAPDDQPTSEMCLKAIESLTAETDLDLAQLECLIVITQTPDYAIPHTSALIHGRLGLSKSVAVFDVSLGCSGYVYGLSIAKAFMISNGFTQGLLVTGDQYSKIMNPEDRNTIPLFGDASTATWLSNDEPAYLIGQFAFGSDGQTHEAIIVRGSGTRAGDAQPLEMNGRGVYSFMMSEVPPNILRCLEQNDVTKDDIDKWVFHQASKYMVESLSNRIGLDIGSVVLDIGDVGNTVSSSVPLALARRVLASQPHGRKVLISGFGVGTSWASCVLTSTKD